MHSSNHAIATKFFFISHLSLFFYILFPPAPSSAQHNSKTNSIHGTHFNTVIKCIVFLPCITSCTKSEYPAWKTWKMSRLD